MGSNTRDKSEGADPLARAYDLYAARLYAYLTVMVGDSQAAEDILQEIFCRLASRGAFFEVADPERYLFRAAHNEAMRWLRGVRRDAAKSRGVELLAAPSAEDADGPSGEAVKRALGQLPPEQTEVVHLKVYDGLTFAQIAEKVGCSTNTAASRYRYACEKLRRMLGGLTDE